MKKILLILSLIPINLWATNYYVSAAGADGNNGTSTGTPWQTLAKVNAQTFNAGDTIFFRAGDVFTGRLNCTRSGSAGNYIVYTRYGAGADPVISGYTQLTSWTSYGSNIWGSLATNIKPYLHNFIVNGAFYQVARYPNTGFIGFTNLSTTSIQTSESSPPNHIGDSAVVKDSRYTLSHVKITNQSGTTYTVAGLTYSLAEGNGFFYFGDTKYLDAVGEYCMTAAGDSIRIYSATNPNTLNTYASTVDSLVYCTGSYLHFVHLTFQGGNLANVLNPFGSGNISFINCTNQKGWFGYDLRAQRDTVTGGIIRDQLNNGVWAPTNNITKYSGFVGVTMRAVGLIPGMGKTGVGGYVGINCPADGLYMYGCDLDSIGYHGVYSSFDSIYIGYNLINHFGITLTDVGGIYLWDPNVTAYNHHRTIIGNMVMNGIGNTEAVVVDAGTMANGIYLDAKSNLVDVIGNTVFNCSGPGLYCHGPTNTFYSNTVYNTAYAAFYVAEYTGGAAVTGIVAKYNTFTCPDTLNAAVYLFTPNNDITSFGTLDSNYYTTSSAVKPFKRRANGAGTPTLQSLSEWRTFFSFDAQSSYQTGTYNLRYNPLFTGKNVYDSGVYIDPSGRRFVQLIPLQQLSSAVLKTLNSGIISYPVGVKLIAN
jgi:hypothetical protein